MRKHLFLFLTILLFASAPTQNSFAEIADSVPESISTAAGQLPATPTPNITTPPSEARAAKSEGAINQSIYAGPPPPTAFQSYVERSAGAALPIFGSEVFSNVPTTYAPLGNVQVNPDYVIGPGDALQIRGWGMIDIDVNVTVSRSGTIYLPKVGTITISGVRYRDLQQYLKTAIGKYYTNFELSASIAQTRSVQVYVTGHAKRPGSYTLSAMSTMLNAMFLSGGPSETGTMRNIKLKRGSGPLITFDLYDILIHGDKSTDLTLQDGDVIYISPVGPLVALLGDVKKPAIYELKHKTSIADLTSWAGGFVPAADLKKVIIEKNVNNSFKTIAELNTDWTAIQNNLSTLSVQPSDIIRVYAPGAAPLEVLPERAFVVVDGYGIQKGVYEIRKGETLPGLINRIGGVTDNGYIFGISIRRESVRRSQQEKIDQMVDRFEKDIETTAKQRFASVNEADEIQAIQAELDSQRQLVQKLRQVRAEGRIILNTLRNEKATLADLPNLPLYNGDHIYIPFRPSTVDVIGAVYQQNTFIWQQGKCLSYYVNLAGGVNQTGDKGEIYRILANGTVLSKKKEGGCNVNPGDAIVVPEKLQRGKSLVQHLKDWTTILYQLGIGAAGVNVLK